MKRLTTVVVLLVLFAVLLAIPLQASAEEQWHYQAAAAVPEPGLVEAVLPAGLFFSDNDASRADLALIGPDGNPRSFELYWKDDNSPRSVALKSSSLVLGKNRTLLWESEVPQDLLAETVKIDMAVSQTIGKVTIEGKDHHGWRILSENAALYNADGRSSVEIGITPAVFERLRMNFKGYDRQFRETPLLIRSVVLSGKSTAKDYVEQTVDLGFSDASEGDVRIVSSLLPGLGLWIKSVVLTTEAQFQGAWSLGQEAIQGGRLQFKPVQSGKVETVSHAGARLEIPINLFWRSRSLVLRLQGKGKYLGAVKALGMTVNLPRLAFYADKPGTYFARTGKGDQIVIHETPGDGERKIRHAVMLSEVNENKQWTPEQLPEKYAVAGGPFNGKGYRWKAGVRIPEPGYYRLALNQEASLESQPEKVRLVKDAVQVPYFPGVSEERTIMLPTTASYDREKNRTVWRVVLPDRSANVRRMSMESQGIFARQVLVEIPNRGRSGWQTVKRLQWQNAENTSSTLNAALDDLPVDTSELRITMEHGDNRPIDVQKITAYYPAPTLLFLIREPGEYFLYGGNRDAADARYDLALVQAHLVNAVPRNAAMGKQEPVASFSGFRYEILEKFEDKSWGLYAVLGTVTVVLMILIVRLFPKEEKG